MLENLSTVIYDRTCAVSTFFFEVLAFYRSLAVASSAPYEAVCSDIQPLRICAKSYDVS